MIPRYKGRKIVKFIDRKRESEGGKDSNRKGTWMFYLRLHLLSKCFTVFLRIV